MIESMDIAFLLVNISSKNLLFSTVTYIISSIINPLLENNHDFCLALINLKSDEPSLVPIVHYFTKSVINFEHWFVIDHASVGRHAQGETVAICKKGIISVLSCFFSLIY